MINTNPPKDGGWNCHQPQPSYIFCNVDVQKCNLVAILVVWEESHTLLVYMMWCKWVACVEENVALLQRKEQLQKSLVCVTNRLLFPFVKHIFPVKSIMNVSRLYMNAKNAVVLCYAYVFAVPLWTKWCGWNYFLLLCLFGFLFANQNICLKRQRKECFKVNSTLYDNTHTWNTVHTMFNSNVLINYVILSSKRWCKHFTNLTITMSAK